MASQGKAGILRTQRLNSYNLLVILCLCIGSLAFGYATAIIGTTLVWYSTLIRLKC